MYHQQIMDGYMEFEGFPVKDQVEGLKRVIKF
jgi:hypothetical protein